MNRNLIALGLYIQDFSGEEGSGFPEYHDIFPYDVQDDNPDLLAAQRILTVEERLARWMNEVNR